MAQGEKPNNPYFYGIAWPSYKPAGQTKFGYQEEKTKIVLKPHPDSACQLRFTIFIDDIAPDLAAEIKRLAEVNAKEAVTGKQTPCMKVYIQREQGAEGGGNGGQKPAAKASPFAKAGAAPVGAAKVVNEDAEDPIPF